jgi:hypothetical protein
MIIFLALLGMQFFANLLIAIAITIIGLMGRKKIYHSIFAVGFASTILVLIPASVYVNTLLSASEYFEKDSELNYKFRDLAVFIDMGAQIEDSGTSTGSRIERYPQLMNVFVQQPMLGCYFLTDQYHSGYDQEGAHLYWMNKLTITGIIGILIFFLIPYYFIRDTLPYFNSEYSFYYIIASLSILSYGLMKVIGGRETWYMFFIILPGLFYLPSLRKRKKPSGTLHK